MVCKIKIEQLNLLVSCSMWKKKGKQDTFTTLIEIREQLIEKKNVSKIWRDFLYTKKKKKKKLFNEKHIIFVIEKKNLHPFLVHV